MVIIASRLLIIKCYHLALIILGPHHFHGYQSSVIASPTISPDPQRTATAELLSGAGDPLTCAFLMALVKYVSSRSSCEALSFGGLFRLQNISRPDSHFSQPLYSCLYPLPGQIRPSYFTQH